MKRAAAPGRVVHGDPWLKGAGFKGCVCKTWEVLGYVFPQKDSLQFLSRLGTVLVYHNGGELNMMIGVNSL